MSTFKNIFKKQFKKDMKKRVKKFQSPFLVKKHIHIEDDCKENSTEQLDFKIL